MRDDKNPTCNYYYHTDNKGETRLKLKEIHKTPKIFWKKVIIFEKD